MCLLGFASLPSVGQDPGDPPPDPAIASPSFFTNNTAACSKAGWGLLGPAYCAAPFPNTTWFDEVAGWSEEQNIPAGQQVITAYHNPSPAGTYVSGSWNGLWNVAKGRGNNLDMDSLMYGAGKTTSSTKVVVELQSWFCVPNYFDSGTGCTIGSPYTPQQGVNEGSNSQQIAENEGHAVNQYTTWYQPTMDARTVDIWDRGGEVVAWDWYGGANDCPNGGYYQNQFTAQCAQDAQFADHSYRDMVTSIQVTLPKKRTGANMGFFLILDQGAWHNKACAGAGSNEPWCAANKMINDLIYAKATYFNQSNYFKDTSTNLPVVAFFQDESDDLSQCNSTSCRYNDAGNTCTSQSSCFNDVYSQVRSWMDTNFGTNAYYMVFAYKTGCPALHAYSDGCYLWVQPYVSTTGAAGISTQSQEYTYFTQGAADDFYANTQNQTGANGHPALVMGGAFKGFDNWMANWWASTDDKILSQECGQTWLATWSEMNQWYNATTNPLKYMMVETWDDYEEGTEIETGISNCIDDSLTTATLNLPHTLNSTFTFSDSTWGTINTIHHFTLYYTTGSGYFVKANNISPTSICTGTVTLTCNIDLSKYTWTHGTHYTLYVQAVGKSGLSDHSTPQPGVSWNP